MSTTSSTRPGTAPAFAQSTMLVTGREVRMRLRSKSFLISTGILLVGILASIIVSGFLTANGGLGGSGDPTRVAVVGSAQQAVSGAESLEGVPADSVEDAQAMVRDGDVEAAVVPDTQADSDGAVLVIGDTSAPDGVVSALTDTPRVELLEEPTTNPAIAYIVAIAFGLVFFISALTFGQIIAQSVVEEKQTRVVELLMSTIPVRALLAGKVLGNSILAFTQIALIALMTGVGLLVTEQTALLAVVGPAVIWFVVFFLFGFVLLASLFAAAASLVSRQEDVGAVTAPVTYLVMIPYFAVIFFNDNPVVMTIMSYVPFSAPVGMPMRLFLGEAQWWEPLVSLAVLIATTAVVVALGSRIYSNSAPHRIPREAARGAEGMIDALQDFTNGLPEVLRWFGVMVTAMIPFLEVEFAAVLGVISGQHGRDRGARGGGRERRRRGADRAGRLAHAEPAHARQREGGDAPAREDPPHVRPLRRAGRQPPRPAPGADALHVGRDGLLRRPAARGADLGDDRHRRLGRRVRGARGAGAHGGVIAPGLGSPGPTLGLGPNRGGCSIIGGVHG